MSNTNEITKNAFKEIKHDDVVMFIHNGCIVGIKYEDFIKEIATGGVEIDEAVISKFFAIDSNKSGKIHFPKGEGFKLINTESEAETNDTIYFLKQTEGRLKMLYRDSDGNLNELSSALIASNSGTGVGVFDKTEDGKSYFRKINSPKDITFTLSNDGKSINVLLDSFVKTLDFIGTNLVLKDQNNETVGTKEIKISNVKNLPETLDLINLGLSGILKLEDPKPSEPGKYELVDIGTYENLVPIIHFGEETPDTEPITTTTGYHNFVYYDGTNFTQIKVHYSERDWAEILVNNSRPTVDFSFEDSYINQDNGKREEASSSFASTDLIPLSSYFNTVELASDVVYHQFALYNKNKIFIPTPFSENGETKFQKPVEACYIALTTNVDDVKKHYIKLYNDDQARKNNLDNIKFPKYRVEKGNLTLVNGYYVDEVTGKRDSTTSNFNASEFFKIPKASYALLSNTYQQIAFQDANGSHIPLSVSTTESRIIKLPSNAEYMAVTVKDGEDWYVEFITKEEEKLLLYQTLILQDQLYNQDLSLVGNKYVDYETGNEVPVSGFNVSKLIPIAPYYNYVTFNSQYDQYAFYDLEGNYISGSLNKSSFIPKNARYLKVTVKDGDNTYSVKFSSNSQVVENVIRVTPDDGYNAIQNAIDSITDASPNNRYIISVAPGLYKCSNSTQYNNPSYPSFIIPKDHVDIVGDSREDCIIWAELPYEDEDIDTSTDRNLHQTIYNWADDCAIKNLTIVAKNIRYAVHQDDPKESDKTRRYENCNIIFIGNKGSLRAFGIGTWSGSNTHIEGGKSISHITYPLAIHNAAKQSKESIWTFKNHEFQNFETGEILKVQNSGSLVGDKLILENCSFSGHVLEYTDWWIYTPGINDHFNHAEWRILGSGNKPFYFSNSVNGKALRITALNIGDKVRFDKSSSAYNYIIKNNKGFFGPLGHPERKIIDGYVVQDFESDFNSFAIGGLSIREDDYLFGTTTSSDSLGKRLGDCSVVNKQLKIIIGSTTKAITFNENYTSKTNDEIISFINDGLGGVAIADEFNIGSEYYPELNDVNNVYPNGGLAPIPKGTFVKVDHGKVYSAENGTKTYGVAFDNIQSRAVDYGEVQGLGRILRNCVLHTSQIRKASGVTIVKGAKYSVLNGELINSTTGEFVAIDNNYILIN